MAKLPPLKLSKITWNEYHKHAWDVGGGTTIGSYRQHQNRTRQDLRE